MINNNVLYPSNTPSHMINPIKHPQVPNKPNTDFQRVLCASNTPGRIINPVQNPQVPNNITSGFQRIYNNNVLYGSDTVPPNNALIRVNNYEPTDYDHSFRLNHHLQSDYNYPFGINQFDLSNYNYPIPVDQRIGFNNVPIPVIQTRAKIKNPISLEKKGEFETVQNRRHSH